MKGNDRKFVFLELKTDKGYLFNYTLVMGKTWRVKTGSDLGVHSEELGAETLGVVRKQYHRHGNYYVKVD